MDHGLAEAHASLAFAMFYDYDFLAAEREFERSIELNPRYATAHQWFGWYLAMVGRYEEWADTDASDERVRAILDLAKKHLLVHGPNVASKLRPLVTGG